MITFGQNIDLIRNKIYQYFIQSPDYLIKRVEHRLKKLGWPSRFSAQPKTDAIAWIREAADFHTRLYIFNYWTDHYGLKDVQITLEVVNQQGVIVGNQMFVLQPRETKTIEAAIVLKDAGITIPFQGSFVLTRTTAGPGLGAPLKLLHEFYSDTFASPIHEYGTVENLRFEENQIGALVYAKKNVEDIFIGVTNCNRSTKTGARELRIRLYSSDGKRVDFSGGNLGSAESAFLSLNQLYPDWKTFVGDQPGNISVVFPLPLGRALLFHKYSPTSIYALNHLTGDKSRPSRIFHNKNILEKIGYGPVWTSGVVFDETFTTNVSLIMNWGFNKSFAVALDIFDQDGKLVKTINKSLAPWQTHSFSLEGALPPLIKPWIGSVLLRVVNEEFVLPSIDANIEILGSNWHHSINIGSSILNLFERDEIKSNLIVNRTKNFSRVRRDENYETYILATNQSSDPSYNRTSATLFRLISGDGTRESARTIAIPPKGSFFGKVEDIFEDADAVMAGNPVATLHIKDTQVKLIAVHLMKNKKTGVVSGDHTFGG